MSLGDFIKRFADEFEDMEDGAIGADTVFTELEDWNSLSTLGVIAMVKMEFNLDITADEIRACDTVKELFDFIQAKMQTAGGSQLPPAVEELFSSFAQRAAGLTPTEHNILRYYADGKGISEVAEEACISINTVRRHNANIYQKLEVGSREELLLYIELFRRCDRLDELL